jgi:hypothetical protein
MGDVYIFLRSTKITDKWVPGDLIVVCDGASCLPLTWRGSIWAPIGPAYPDPKKSYKNGIKINQQTNQNDYMVIVIWISPDGPLREGVVEVLDLIPVGIGAGGGNSGYSGQSTVDGYDAGGADANSEGGNCG